jgi:hypothetical protein
MAKKIRKKRLRIFRLPLVMVSLKEKGKPIVQEAYLFFDIDRAYTCFCDLKKKFDSEDELLWNDKKSRVDADYDGGRYCYRSGSWKELLIVMKRRRIHHYPDDDLGKVIFYE